MNPVCYGSVAFVNPGSPVCKGCSLTRDCLARARARVKELPDSQLARGAAVRLDGFMAMLGSVTALASITSRRGVTRRPLSPQEALKLQSLPQRARATAERLAKLGWFEYAREKTNLGMMPAGVEGTVLEMAISLMLIEPIRRTELVRYVTVFKALSHGSVQVEVSTALTVLEFGGLAKVEHGTCALIQNL